MTNVTVLPVRTPGVEDQEQPVADELLAEDEDQERRERQHAVNELLAEAGEAGRGAAGWVRELAARQAEERHRAVLERAADAIKQTAGREVVPNGDGQLAEELAYDLSADVVTGSPYAQALPELAVGERIALVAACALAAAMMPRTVLGDLERELPALAATMDAAVTAGRTARTQMPQPGHSRPCYQAKQRVDDTGAVGDTGGRAAASPNFDHAPLRFDRRAA
ncbi:hypothetical protein [Kitasatospora sp. NPDC056531]|uniref:hypothetical protein n=1 Tax=Kitasatospora sp. NPDC056531 TaxID=3345856 RepID=UPI0036C77E7A